MFRLKLAIIKYLKISCVNKISVLQLWWSLHLKLIFVLFNVCLLV
jgi:hypothetical protein